MRTLVVTSVLLACVLTAVVPAATAKCTGGSVGPVTWDIQNDLNMCIGYDDGTTSFDFNHCPPSVDPIDECED